MKNLIVGLLLLCSTSVYADENLTGPVLITCYFPEEILSYHDAYLKPVLDHEVTFYQFYDTHAKDTSGRSPLVSVPVNVCVITSI